MPAEAVSLSSALTVFKAHGLFPVLLVKANAGSKMQKEKAKPKAMVDLPGIGHPSFFPFTINSKEKRYNR